MPHTGTQSDVGREKEAAMCSVFERDSRAETSNAIHTANSRVSAPNKEQTELYIACMKRVTETLLRK